MSTPLNYNFCAKKLVSSHKLRRIFQFNKTDDNIEEMFNFVDCSYE